MPGRRTVSAKAEAYERAEQSWGMRVAARDRTLRLGEQGGKGGDAGV